MTPRGIDPKAAAGAFGAAVATLVWTLLAAFVPGVRDQLSAKGLAALTGATATIVGALLAWLVPNYESKIATSQLSDPGEVGGEADPTPEPDDPDVHEGATN